MAETPFQTSTRALLLDTLRKQEADAGQQVTGLVKQVAENGSVTNLMISRLKTAGVRLEPLEMKKLEGVTDDEQRKEIAGILKAGNAPLAWTVIRVKEAGEQEKDENVLLFRPDGGAWAKGLVSATGGLVEAIVATAIEEWKHFGEQEVDVEGKKVKSGLEEHSEAGSARVALYWTEGVGKPGITGKDRNQFWSAAFISYVMLKAGAGALFRRSDHHQAYIHAAMVAAREKSSSYGYWGARLEDHAPQVGDLICAWRKKKISFEDAENPGWYASHCDLVVARTDTTVTVIGGNVDQSVTKRTFRLVGGKVASDTFPNAFAILMNRMSAAAEAVVSAELADHPVSVKLPALPKVEFEPVGEAAPIRGRFDVTADKIQRLCTGSRQRYAVYAAAIAESSVKFGINPLFVLANFINQGVNDSYRNPWGISVDFYPFGPGGSQLGQPNGKVKNGPRKFGEDEWRIAFDRQFAVVATGKAYKNASTIGEWARIDAPPGAANDVNSTNAAHGRNVGELYDRLVGSLEA